MSFNIIYSVVAILCSLIHTLRVISLDIFKQQVMMQAIGEIVSIDIELVTIITHRTECNM